MLSFIGVGNAFSNNLGNCSAYYKMNDNMLLIDCGENIFSRLLDMKLLENLKSIYILITHFHTDHIGSLGSLLFYCDKIGISDVKILYPNLSKIDEYIKLIGVQYCNYKLIKPEEVGINIIPQVHNKMEAYGYILEINEKKIYYSGDTQIVNDNVKNMLLEEKLDYFYQDVRIDKNNYHITLEELSNIIPVLYRKKVTCMHYGENEKPKIKRMGFSIAEKIK